MEMILDKFSLDSKIEEKRNKIDEVLVSLRFLKKIDDFLIETNCSKRELANKLNCSESYISQLMAGTKKINVSFINKFEKYFNIEFEVKLRDLNKCVKIHDFSNIQMINSSNEVISFKNSHNKHSNYVFIKKTSSNDFVDIEFDEIF